jgi:hypothetical protein
VYDQIRKIGLPFPAPDGGTIPHTLQGEWLVGSGFKMPGSDLPTAPFNGHRASFDVRSHWGHGFWYVIRRDSGKLVVYQDASVDGRDPQVNIYDSFEAMKPNVPPNIYEEAALKGASSEHPAVPLEGV